MAKLVLVFALLVAIPVSLFYVAWVKVDEKPKRRRFDDLHYDGFKEGGR